MILDIDEASEFIRNKQAEGKKTVFTNGCFDLLHSGHLDLLERASKQGDILLVAINSDNSVRKLKGEKKPLFPEQERAELIDALEPVDIVVIFNEETPFEVIEALKPDVLIKGGDWDIDNIVGRDTVWKRGGKVISLPLLEGYSSSYVISRIRKLFCPD
ncbi:MAG: D-glycero-beta-D-manno-heptose 1-phosphate adenylyltransferase [Candidatus Coatesbacteria bacterium]|nr:D-glycero-beta-D-manno-heptose 1-phosphate adenylyltransferase [Candidatus Coatesbacteria bacterium]